MSSRSTLVTGAAGFAGGHLLDRLPAAAGAIWAWHRPGGSPPRAVAGVRWEGVDLLDASGVTSALDRVRPSVVFHCAGAAHVGQSWGRIEATRGLNVLGTHHLLEGLRRAGVEARVLVVSSAMVYRPAPTPVTEDHELRPPSPYGISKLAQEMVGRDRPAAGIEVLIARPFNHIGPRQSAAFAASSFARQIAAIEAGRQAPVIDVGNLEARREVTDVRDTVDAYRAIAEGGVAGRPYNVSSGRAVTIRSLLDALVSRARASVTVRVDPARYQPNDLPVLVGDNSRITHELGWTPRVPFEQTIDDLLDFWRNQ